MELQQVPRRQERRSPRALRAEGRADVRRGDARDRKALRVALKTAAGAQRVVEREASRRRARARRSPTRCSAFGRARELCLSIATPPDAMTGNGDSRGERRGRLEVGATAASRRARRPCRGRAAMRTSASARTRSAARHRRHFGPAVGRDEAVLRVDGETTLPDGAARARARARGSFTAAVPSTTRSAPSARYASNASRVRTPPPTWSGRPRRARRSLRSRSRWTGAPDLRAFEIDDVEAGSELTKPRARRPADRRRIDVGSS